MPKETDVGLAEARRRRERPKRLRVEPSGTGAAGGQTDELYEFDHQSILSSMWVRYPPRPLPAAASMAALAEAKLSDKRSELGADASAPKHNGAVMPLLRRFVESLESEDRKKQGERGGQSSEHAALSVADNATVGNIGANEFKDGNIDESEGAFGGTGGFLPSARGIAESGMDPLTDPASTTLSSGQRTRYAAYLSEARAQGKKPPTDSTPRGREFRSLRDAVREERKMYCSALLEFRQRNVERFLIGFKVTGPASKFVDVGSRLVAQYRERVQKSTSGEARPAELYGSCVQAISLHDFMSNVGECCVVAPDDKPLSRIQSGGASFDETSFSANVLLTKNLGGSTTRVTEEQIASLNKTEILEPLVGHLPDGPCLVCEDSTAKELALEHGATAIVASEAMIELLRRPGHESTRWSVPLLRTEIRKGPHDSIVDVLILEEPLPIQSTSRQWLAKGLAQGLQTKMSDPMSSSKTGPREDTTKPERGIQYVYSLLVLPPPTHAAHTGRHNAPIKVLVRTMNEFFDETGRPIRLRMNLEYFPERGMEVPTAHERAVWIMEKVIQPSCRVLFSRVDPNTAKLICIEEKGVAHALAIADTSGGKGSPAFEPASHFGAFSTMMRGIGNLLEHGRYILCLPGRGVPPTLAATSASVHRECSAPFHGTQAAKNAAAISLEHEFAVADSVLTSQSFLMTCYRTWQWTSGRLPFTFPAKE